jgi:tRNA threonylcarbamoyladenosine biosynthesis protein TsaE
MNIVWYNQNADLFIMKSHIQYMKFITKNDQQTRELGEKLAKNFVESEKNRSRAIVISLEGDLGAGKTTFTQGLAKGLGVMNWIKSPTFILMREHTVSKNPESSIQKLVHIDCYRLTKPETLLDIGLKDFLNDSKNIVLIEWGERLAQCLPKNVIKIKFIHLKENEREVVIN